MLTFTQANQDRIEQSGRKIVHRASLAFPGYSVITVYDAASWTGVVSLTVSSSGNPNLVITPTEVPAPLSPDNNEQLASDLADYINANFTGGRAIWEVSPGAGSGGATQARLILLGTRGNPSIDLAVSGSWASYLTTPNTGWTLDTISGDYPLDGYLPVLTGIAGYGQTLNAITRETSIDDIEIRLTDESAWKRAVKWFGAKHTPCTLYYGVWDEPRTTSGSQISWQSHATYWVKSTRFLGQSAIEVKLYSLQGLLQAKRTRIPEQLGRHPFQIMRKILGWAGFVDGVDPRIDWASLAISTDPDRGHFNLSHYPDYAMGLNIPSTEEVEDYSVWALLEELAFLMAGTIRETSTGQLTYVPYDRDAAALEVWDLDLDTGFDGQPPETVEAEELVVNRVVWDYANSGGGRGYNGGGGEAETRSSQFALEDGPSIEVYGETFDLSLESRWLNAVSFSDVAWGATGQAWDTNPTSGATERTSFNLGYSQYRPQRNQAFPNNKFERILWHSEIESGIPLTGGVYIPNGTIAVGKDDHFSLRTAVLNGFCGTRCNGYAGPPGAIAATASTTLDYEDSYATLSNGREAYVQFEPATTVVRGAYWESPYNQTFPLSRDGGTTSFVYSEDAARQTSAPYPGEPAQPEVVKVASHTYNVPNPASTFGGILGHESFTSNYYLYRADHNGLLVYQTGVTIDTSYNAEGFTNGRGGFGTLPPRRDYSAGMSVVDGSADGGWLLGAVSGNGKTVARVSDATIQTYRSKDILTRFRYGAWQLRVVTPISKLRFQIGDVVSVITSRFLAFGREGLDETVTFEITGKRLLGKGFTVEWELTTLKDSAQPNIPGQVTYPTRPTIPVDIPVTPPNAVTDNALEDAYTALSDGTTPDQLITT